MLMRWTKVKIAIINWTADRAPRRRGASATDRVHPRIAQGGLEKFGISRKIEACKKILPQAYT
jgi:hypothetical protein